MHRWPACYCKIMLSDDMAYNWYVFWYGQVYTREATMWKYIWYVKLGRAILEIHGHIICGQNYEYPEILTIFYQHQPLAIAIWRCCKPTSTSSFHLKAALPLVEMIVAASDRPYNTGQGTFFENAGFNCCHGATTGSTTDLLYVSPLLEKLVINDCYFVGLAYQRVILFLFT